MRLCSLLCFLLVPLFGKSQQQKIVDSLDSLVVGKNGWEEYDALHQLAVELAATDNSKALELSVRAETVALKLGDSLRIRKSKRLKGQILLRLGRPIEAVSAIQLYIRDQRWVRADEEQLMLTNLIGVGHLMMGQFDKALEYHLQTNHLAVQMKNPEFLETSLNNIGITYYKLKAYQKALSYLLRGREIADSLGAKSVFAAINISLCYSYLGNFSAASEYLGEASQLCGQDCSSRSLTHLKYAAGCLKYCKRNPNGAKEDFTESFEFARQINDHRMMLDNIYFLAKISLEDGRIDEAERFLRAGEQIIHSGTPFNMEIVKVYEQLSTLYLQVKNFDRASAYQSKYIKYRDSLYNEAVITHLMQLESEHQEMANQAKINEQQALLYFNQQMIRRQKSLNVLSVVVIVLTIVLLVFLFRNYRRKQMVTAVLEQKVKERTIELDLSRSELMKQLRRQELFARQASTRVIEKISTVKGLCLTAKKESPDFVANKYFERIGGTSTEIEEYIKSLFFKN